MPETPRPPDVPLSETEVELAERCLASQGYYPSGYLLRLAKEARSFLSSAASLARVKVLVERWRAEARLCDERGDTVRSEFAAGYSAARLHKSDELAAFLEGKANE